MMGSGNITGGSLLPRESRIVARLLVAGKSPLDAKMEVLKQNLFQNSSKATTTKYLSLVIARLSAIPGKLLRIVAEGDEETSRLALFAAVLKTTPLVASFVREVVAEKIRCFDPELGKNDWVKYLDTETEAHPEFAKWTESSRRKIGQVVFRTLMEAGYLDRKTKRLAVPRISPELADAIAEAGKDILKTMIPEA